MKKNPFEFCIGFFATTFFLSKSPRSQTQPNRSILLVLATMTKSQASQQSNSIQSSLNAEMQ